MSADTKGAVPQCRHTDTHLFQTIQWWWSAFEEIRHIQESLLTVTCFQCGLQKCPSSELGPCPSATRTKSSQTSSCYWLKFIMFHKPVFPVLRWQESKQWSSIKLYDCITFFSLTCIVQVNKKPEIQIKNIVAFNRNAGFLEPLSMSAFPAVRVTFRLGVVRLQWLFWKRRGLRSHNSLSSPPRRVAEGPACAKTVRPVTNTGQMETSVCLPHTVQRMLL